LLSISWLDENYIAQIEAGLMNEFIVNWKLYWWNNSCLSSSWIDEIVIGKVEAGYMKW